MTDLKPTVLQALSRLPARAALSFARDEAPLPAVTVAEENVSVFARADGEPYLEEHTLSLDVYAASQGALAALSLAADEAMTALGLRLTAAQEAFDETAYAWRKTLRYRALVHQNTIYQ